jgi:hypothetical protein
VAFDARQSARLRPTTVAIHDYGDVTGDSLKARGHLTASYHLESVADRQVARVANDEIRMTKLEGMMNDRAKCFFVRASNLFRHSTFVLRHSVAAEIGAVVDEFTI